ncbi:SRPBCC family protein [Oscillatoria salina]|uniref:SRPBCC family protein n=1 Tax=Oscillatoria salina TaxID=331517 RepID=UPI001CC95EE2|nr:SRPBCC family protein [Oscillatoria salina]MBZ8182166.1 cyclase [Oscillatoria salina IIICB1]
MEEVTNIGKKPNQPDSKEVENWASLIGGGALVLLGLKERSLRGVLMTLAGGGLVYHGMPKENLGDKAQAALGLNQTIKAEKTVTINKPVAELYNYWHNFENLPTFMEHLQSVTVQDEKRSHWVAKAPLDTKIEWDAEIIKDEPNHLIAWASVDNADIENSGFVRFQPAPAGRGTQVKVAIEYNPPGGIVTDALAKLFGESPEQRVGNELSRFKQLMEAGEIATIAGQPQGS